MISSSRHKHTRKKGIHFLRFFQKINIYVINVCPHRKDVRNLTSYYCSLFSSSFYFEEKWLGQRERETIRIESKSKRTSSFVVFRSAQKIYL